MDRRLPVGIRSFEDIRHGGYRYVDKTAYVHRLVHKGNPTLLCRPRGFGKSLLVSNMCAYLEGRRELFEGLEIDSLEENVALIEGRTPWVARPVFHLDLTGQDHHTASLEEVLADQLARWDETYGASRSSTLCDRFFDLLEAAHEQHGHRAAVLVDGYDRPILDALDDPVMEEHNRCLLGAFFSVLKDADEHHGLVFLTGVTRPITVGSSPLEPSTELLDLYQYLNRLTLVAGPDGLADRPRPDGLSALPLPTATGVLPLGGVYVAGES